MPAKAFPNIEVAFRAEWRAWLAAHHGQAGSIWLVTFRKHVADKHLSAAEAAEEALCFGWMDSLPRALDADRTMLRLSPRKPGSAWSALNKERAKRVEEAARFAARNIRANQYRQPGDSRARVAGSP